MRTRTRLLPFVLALCACSGSGSNSGSGTLTPVVPAGGATQAAFGQPWTHTILVQNADGNPTFTLLAGPAGMAVGGGGVLSWTPAYADLGTSTVRVRVSDSDESAVLQFDLRVHQSLSMGTAYSPQGHTSSTTVPQAVAYLQDRSIGQTVAYHTNWRDPGDTAGEIPGLALTGIAARDQFGVEPTFVLGWADGNGVADLTSDSAPFNNTWSNAETRQEHLDMIVDFVTTYQPARLGLANEFNIWWSTHQAQYADWQTQYIAVYDAVKAVSPGTDVYATFQLEFLKDDATNTGWTGGVTWACFDLMAMTGKLDIAAFTSYPYFEYADPSLIAAGHYSEITAHWMSGPVTFTELGWLEAPSGAYPGDRTHQAHFVERFFDLTQGLELDVVQWLFLHDFDGQGAFPPFVGIGLRSNDASDIRPADAAWRAAVALREEPGNG